MVLGDVETVGVVCGGWSGLSWQRAREEQMVEPTGREEKNKSEGKGAAAAAWRRIS